MTETFATAIPAELIGTEQGDALVAQCSDTTRTIFESEGKRVTRIEISAVSGSALATAEVTYNFGAPCEFGDENELPAVEGDNDEGDH